MQPICILHDFVFSDVIPHQNMLKFHLFIDLTCHEASKSHIGLSVICHGLYVMHEGLHAKSLSVVHHDCNCDSCVLQ